jgi:hypothetical protein
MTTNANTLRDAVTTLRQYNEWRRGADVQMLDPKAIGEAIDVVLTAVAAHLSRQIAGLTTSEARATSARLNGKLGGRPKKQPTKNRAKTQRNTSVETQRKPSTNPAAPVEVVLVPSILDKPAFHAAWGDWLAYRTERRLPAYKPRNLTAQYAALAEWGIAGAIASIRESIRNQWQGLFEPKVKPGSNHGGAQLEERFNKF